MENPNYRLLQPVVTAREMAEIDRKTIAEIGIPGMVLMENAGRKVVESIKSYLGGIQNKKIIVVCGKGNNGGDGYVITRYLKNMGAEVDIYLLGLEKNIKGDARQNLEILKKLKIKINSLPDKNYQMPLKSAELIIDAILGTGVVGPLKAEINEIVKLMNQSGVPIISVDLPTGINTDTGAVYGDCVKAACTVTMGHLKRGLLFSPGRDYTGKIQVAEIGFPGQVSEQIGIKCFRITRDYLEAVLPKRQRDTYKNRCGQVLLIAGSAGLTGAAALSAEASLKTGAGMAILGIPKSLNPVLEQKLTEVMTQPLPETTETQTLHFDAHQAIAEKFTWSNVMAVGPGITTEPNVIKLVKWLLQTYDKTIVLDADGINCLQNDTDVITNSKAELILTPHPGELSRLTKIAIKEILANPVEVAKETASRLKSVIVLKGAPTVIASPGGYVFINSTGNPGMATAGMGDVLTGMIAGLKAQGMSALDSAIAGVYLHGLAGDVAASESGQAGLLAGDVIKFLPVVLKPFERNYDDEMEFI